MPPPLRRPVNARQEMPETTAFIDELRAVFGKDEIDSAMRRGKADGTFWAIENGCVVGQPPRDVVERHLAGPESVPKAA